MTDTKMTSLETGKYAVHIGLGIHMHHHIASKFHIDTLHEHGFCSSYKEVKKFERSAEVSNGTYIPNYSAGQFIQYLADNVDHTLERTTA
jgi:hypothetical protein